MYSTEAYHKATKILTQKKQQEMMLQTCLEAGICPVCGEKLQITRPNLTIRNYYVRCSKDELHYNLASTKKPDFMK